MALAVAIARSSNRPEASRSPRLWSASASAMHAHAMTNWTWK
jgi:hypothetical protein